MSACYACLCISLCFSKVTKLPSCREIEEQVEAGIENILVSNVVDTTVSNRKRLKRTTAVRRNTEVCHMH